MKMSDIEVGKLYKGEYGGRVRVIEKGLRTFGSQYENAVKVEVIKSDDTVARVEKVTTRRIKGPWTHEDEVRRRASMEQAKQEERFANALHNAGFSTAEVSHRHHHLPTGWAPAVWLQLEGQDALDAIAILLEHRSQSVDGAQTIQEITERTGHEV